MDDSSLLFWKLLLQEQDHVEREQGGQPGCERSGGLSASPMSECSLVLYNHNLALNMTGMAVEPMS